VEEWKGKERGKGTACMTGPEEKNRLEVLTDASSPVSK
jgi:hypothetical protein